MHTRIPKALLALLAALALLAGACGNDDDPVADVDTDAVVGTDTGDDTSTDTAYPLTVSSGGIDTVVDAVPEAIVSLSPTATEMLFAVGAGDQVVAVDDFSTFPAEAPTTDLSGFDPNVEAVIAFDPDLVIVQGDANDLVAGLAAVDVPTLVLPAAQALDDTYAQLEILGTVTGRTEEATEVIGGMQAEIEALVDEVPERDEPLTYFHELDDTLFTATSTTFIGEVYALAGLDNVADAADPDGEAFGFPQVSPEFLVDADPDLIFLADAQCCGQDPDTVAARPGFDQITAVQDGHVFVVDEDVASRWGPRIVDFLASVVEQTATIGV